MTHETFNFQNLVSPSHQNHIFPDCSSFTQCPLPCSIHAEVGPSVVSVIIVAGRPSKALKGISDFGGPRLAPRIQLLLDTRSSFEISIKEQQAMLPIILLSVMHLCFPRCITEIGDLRSILIVSKINNYSKRRLLYLLSTEVIRTRLF